MQDRSWATLIALLLLASSLASGAPLEEKDNTLLKKGEDRRLGEGVSHAPEDADEFCPAKRCADLKGKDILKWDCFASMIFGPPSTHGRYVAQVYSSLRTRI